MNELQQEEATQIYDTYYRKFEIRYNANLVITRYRQRLLSAIRTYPVVVVRGSTGCGKTTQVPQYILDEYIERGIHCNIAVTQPRRIAATSVAARVCQERSWTLGSVVGFQIALDSVTSPDTRITYMTTGVLLQKLIAAKNMNSYTHIIIDEVHERDQDTDLTMLIVRKFLRSNSRATKVILMSATIDTDIFTSYFESPIHGKLLPAPAIDIDAKPHTVSEHYITELNTLGEVPPVDPDNPGIHEKAFDLACNLISTFDRIEQQEQSDEDSEKIRGSVLVFLPGYEEIADLRIRLGKLQENKKWSILPLHSTITLEEQHLVFKPPFAGRRKIILSTNIAESSVTVPDIRYVIDFCLTKILFSDPETNYCSLQVRWAAKSNCEQRKGRAGRVAQGRVYRMVPASFYDRHLEMYSVPEMKRCPLELVILKVKRLDLGEPKALLSLALEKPALMDIERAILKLKEVGALTTTVNGVYSSSDGDLTFIGEVMAKLPLDVNLTKLILLGFVFNCLEECIIMAASLSVQNFFSRPFQKVLPCYKSRLAWASDTFSDVLAYLAAYTVWQKHLRTGMFQRPIGNRANRGNLEAQWCKSSYIQHKRIKEVKNLVDDLKRRLEDVGIKTIPRNCPENHLDEVENVLILKVVICGAFYPNYFVQEEVEQKDIFRQIPKLDPRNTVMVTGLPPKHSFLYESAIINLFRECSPHVQVTFDEQKAYIRFGKNAGEEGTGVQQEVYIALKMRHQRERPSIPAMSSEEVNQKLQILAELKSQKEPKPNTFGRKVSYMTGKVLPRVPLPKVDKITVRLNVTHVVDCGHFWAQYSDDYGVPGKEAFLKEKINMYSGSNLQPVKGPLRRGMLVLAPFLENQQRLYYRACIEDVPEETKAEVFFLDYGNTTTLLISDLREIDQKLGSEILTQPALAVQCKLSGIRPAANKASGFGHWSHKAREWFFGYVFAQEVLGQIYSVNLGVIRLELRKVLPEGEVDINQTLVNMGLAEAAEEDYMSKQNHMLREKCQNMDATELAVMNEQQEEENVLHLGQTENLFRRMTLHESLTRTSARLQVKGPTSPLEVSYCGVTKLTSGRRVKVERDSVNSVTLNREPENPHNCMLVACSVNLASAGTSIIARSTTEMPSIHGLPALMVLLFSPQAEFRTDPQRSKYTGAITGLGVCPNTSKPIYTDHDIEMVFDTVIDMRDIVDINAVRIYMNFILGISEPDAQSGPGAIKDCQDKARSVLLRLLNRKREYQERQPYSPTFTWNQIPPQYRHVGTVNFKIDCPQLFKLHDSVELDDISNWIINQLQVLEARASDSEEREVNKCPICDHTCYTRKDLKVHLSSEEHRRHYNYFMKK